MFQRIWCVLGVIAGATEDGLELEEEIGEGVGVVICEDISPGVGKGFGRRMVTSALYRTWAVWSRYRYPCQGLTDIPETEDVNP